MLEAQGSGSVEASQFVHAANGIETVTRIMTLADIPAILALQDDVIASLQQGEKHFLKKRNSEYLDRLLTFGIGIGTFDTSNNRLVAQALLRRQTFDACETNCNVNNFLHHAEERAPGLAKVLLPELHALGWGVIGTMLTSPDPTYHKKGLARGVIAAMMTEYQRQGGKHVFASTAIDNQASQKVFDAFGFARLADAVDPKDGWRCVIFHHPPLQHLHHGHHGY